MIKSRWVNKNFYADHLKKYHNKNSSIYHQTLWHQIIEKGFNLNTKYICTEDNSGKIYCLTPVFCKNKYIFNFIGSPLSGLFTIYLGPVFLENSEVNLKKEILSSLHELVLTLNVDYVEWGIDGIINENFEIFNFLEVKKYKYHQRPTLIIDLSMSEEEIWKNFKSRARNMIRKSENKKVVTEEEEIDIQWIKNFFDMLRQTFSRQGLSVPHPLSFYRELLNLKSSKSIKCYSAFLNNAVVAKSIFLIDGNKLLYFSGTSTLDGMKVAANSQIQWRAMTDAKKLNLNYYDLGGIGVNSIDKFKESFNGKLVVHHRWIYKRKIFNIVYFFVKYLSKLKLININL